MADIELGAVQAQFAELVWKNEPLFSKQEVDEIQKLIDGFREGADE